MGDSTGYIKYLLINSLINFFLLNHKFIVENLDIKSV